MVPQLSGNVYQKSFTKSGKGMSKLFYIPVNSQKTPGAQKLRELFLHIISVFQCLEKSDFIGVFKDASHRETECQTRDFYSHRL